MLRIIFIALTALLGACSEYQVSVNERVVYNPPQLFARYSIPDVALKKCVSDTISEQKITQAKQLLTLACPKRAIQNLDGLEVFTELKTLGLQENHISHLAPLGVLLKLEQINLAGNTVADYHALLGLKKLTYLNLTGNRALDCTKAADEIGRDITLVCQNN